MDMSIQSHMVTYMCIFSARNLVIEGLFFTSGVLFLPHQCILIEASLNKKGAARLTPATP